MVKSKWCEIAAGWFPTDRDTNEYKWGEKIRAWFKKVGDNDRPEFFLTFDLDREAVEFVLKHGMDKDGNKGGGLKMTLMYNKFKDGRQPDFRPSVAVDPEAFDKYVDALKARRQSGNTKAPAKTEDPDDDLPS